MTAAVQLRQASVERSGKRVVSAIDMDVPPAGWFGLIGANGSGKTSLLRALAGRLPLAGGRCLVGEVDLAPDRMARARHFGFAPPADRLPESLRVRDLLDLTGGDVATVLVQEGTLRVGDSVVCGVFYGKGRVMIDDRGRKTDEALPSFPVEIL